MILISDVKVATCSGLGVFWRLLFQWRGSIYKLVWQNLLLYMTLYYGLSIMYRFLLNSDGRVRPSLYIKLGVRPYVATCPSPFSNVLFCFVKKKQVLKTWGLRLVN